MNKRLSKSLSWKIGKSQIKSRSSSRSNSRSSSSSRKSGRRSTSCFSEIRRIMGGALAKGEAASETEGGRVAKQAGGCPAVRVVVFCRVS